MAGRIQAVLTALKVIGILLIAGGVFAFSKDATFANLASPADRGRGVALHCLAAVLAALWAYEGWHQMPMAAAEVKQPERNVPRALIGGLLLIIFLYCLANFAYLYALPFDEVAHLEFNGLPAGPSGGFEGCGHVFGTARHAIGRRNLSRFHAGSFEWHNPAVCESALCYGP